MRFPHRGNEPDIIEQEKKVEQVIEEWEAASKETDALMSRIMRLSLALSVRHRQGQRPDGK